MRKSMLAGIAGLLLAGGLSLATAPGASAASPTYTCTKTTTYTDSYYGTQSSTITQSNITGPAKIRAEKDGFSCVKNP
jgi:hypothetical protein